MKSKFAAIIFTTFLLLPPAALLAQQRSAFRHFYADDGLSESRVTTVTQDYLGFLWVGTNNGLNRFDGYSFKVYRNILSDTTTIRSNIVERVFEDSHHHLWIGTSEGLNFYNRDKDHFEFLKPPSDSSAAIKAICEDKHGVLWVGGWKGLQRVNIFKKELEVFTPGFSPQENMNVVTDIVSDRKENLWVATPQGLDCYNFSKKTFIHYSPTSEDALPEPDIRTLLETQDGTLWIGTRRGIYTHRPESEGFKHVIPEVAQLEINDLYEDNQFLFIATVRGFYQYDMNTGKIRSYFKSENKFSLSDNLVRAIFKDDNKNLWLGTFNGLDLADHTTKLQHIGKPEVNKPGLANDYVLSLRVDSDMHIWVGTGEGMEVLNVSRDGSVNVITSQHPALKQLKKPILSMTTDAANTIWFSVWPGGFYKYNPKTKTLTELNYPLSCGLPIISYNDAGSIWVGCETGLHKYNIAAGKFEPVKDLGNHAINYVHEDAQKNLWLGYQFGLICRAESGQIEYFKKNTNSEHSLNAHIINCMYRDDEGVRWIGTDLGLYAMKPDSTFESFYLKYGFPNHTVTAILEDDHDNLWLSTNDGLYRFNKKSHAVRSFDTFDGLQGKEFIRNTSVKMPDGRLIFGGTKGLNIFSPDSIQDNPFPPKVVITDFKIMNKYVPIGGNTLSSNVSVVDQIMLHHSDAEFSFEFVALNYSAPHRNRYAYKMEGFDKAWNYCGTRRFASYTNLPSGKEYTFRVKASNNDNIWNETGAAINIYIAPPYWETWWFKALAYMLTLTLAYIGYRFRVNSIRKHRIELRKQVNEQTAKLKLANEQIEKWNDVLQEHNKKLQNNVKDVNIARILVKPLSFDEFREIYPDEQSCYRFLEELKWKPGFTCMQCHSTQFATGSVPFSKRCVKCNHVERVTSGTIFTRLKFPITKAFYLLFLVTGNNNLTVRELSEILSLRQQTCWIFRSKVEKLIREKGGIKNLKEGWKSIILTEEEKVPQPWQ